MGSIEASWALTGEFQPLAVVTVLRLCSGPTPEQLRQALDTLQPSQQMLNVSISQRGGRYQFQPDPQRRPIPLSVQPWSGDDGWQAAAETGLNTLIDHTVAPLIRCTYLYQPGIDAPADLILVQHHATLDAASSMALNHQLLCLCGGLEDELDLTPRELEPPLDERIPPEFSGSRRPGRLFSYFRRQMADEIRYRRRLGGRRQPPIYPTSRNQVFTRSMSLEHTAALTRGCRRRRLTINSALTAAMLLTLRRHLYQDQPLPMRAINFADLRPYLRPPLTADILGCYISMLRYTVDLAPTTDLWETAELVQEAAGAAIKDGDKFTAAEMSQNLMKLVTRYQPFRLGAVALSFPGPLELRPSYGPIQLRGIHAFISNNRLGPEYAAFAKILFGRLSWDFIIMDTDMDAPLAEIVADETNQILERAAAQYA